MCSGTKQIEQTPENCGNNTNKDKELAVVSVCLLSVIGVINFCLRNESQSNRHQRTNSKQPPPNPIRIIRPPVETPNAILGKIRCCQVNNQHQVVGCEYADTYEPVPQSPVSLQSPSVRLILLSSIVATITTVLSIIRQEGGVPCRQDHQGVLTYRNCDQSLL